MVVVGFLGLVDIGMGKTSGWQGGLMMRSINGRQRAFVSKWYDLLCGMLTFFVILRYVLDYIFLQCASLQRAHSGELILHHSHA